MEREREREREREIGRERESGQTHTQTHRPAPLGIDYISTIYRLNVTTDIHRLISIHISTQDPPSPGGSCGRHTDRLPLAS